MKSPMLLRFEATELLHACFDSPDWSLHPWLCASRSAFVLAFTQRTADLSTFRQPLRSCWHWFLQMFRLLERLLRIWLPVTLRYWLTAALGIRQLPVVADVSDGASHSEPATTAPATSRRCIRNIAEKLLWIGNGWKETGAKTGAILTWPSRHRQGLGEPILARTDASGCRPTRLTVAPPRRPKCRSGRPRADARGERRRGVGKRRPSALLVSACPSLYHPLP